MVLDFIIGSYYLADWSKTEKKNFFKIIFRIAILPDGSLRILNASKSDEGKYVCRGENVFGSAEIIASLSVKGKTARVNVLQA